MINVPVIRYTILTALFLAGAMAGAPSASAAPPRFYTLMVPARDDTPQNVRLYATLGGVGNGNRIGDPVILATRAGLNPRQEWMPVDPRYPNLPEQVVTGHGPNCLYIIIPVGCSFEGAGSSTSVSSRVKLVSRYSGKCLSISGVVAQGADITQQTCRETDPKQVWYVTVSATRTGFQVDPVYWYRHNELRCLGPAARSAGRQLAVHRRRTTTEACPHWVIKHAVTAIWNRPFTNPF